MICNKLSDEINWIISNVIPESYYDQTFQYEKRADGIFFIMNRYENRIES